MTENLSERLNLAVSESLILRIDNWRRQHPRIPTRAEATRLSRATILTLRTRDPMRLPPPVNDEGRPRWHPQTARGWFAKKGKAKAGRPRSVF
jgi:hypothetical protein